MATSLTFNDPESRDIRAESERLRLFAFVETFLACFIFFNFVCCACPATVIFQSTRGIKNLLLLVTIIPSFIFHHLTHRRSLVEFRRGSVLRENNRISFWLKNLRGP